MKILSLALLLTASLAFLLVGCTDNSSPIEASADQALSTGTSPSALAKGGPMIHSASGNCGDVIDGGPVTWAFDAREDAGGCSGECQIFLHGQGKADGWMHGKVMSLAVYPDYPGGKAAVVGGLFTKGALSGNFFAFVVIDYGEGKKAQADKYTRIVFFNTDETYAREVWLYAPDDVVNVIAHQWEVCCQVVLDPDFVRVPTKWGNVQVK
jgi:hypothetical protein